MLKTCSGEIESSQESQILSLAKKWNLPKRFQNEDDDVIKKHPKFPTRQDLKVGIRLAGIDRTSHR